MLRNKLLIKAFAVFFILEIVMNTVWASVSYALTAGPTAPEATSFEPVDTTDMVNPLTGDFVYNLPLLEVPGPAGGFPLSLSYHAGIMTGEEASWVGLGWTLNPGAINRNVNGYADDHKDAEQTTRFVWNGGVRHEAEVGVSIGIAGVAAISEGITIGYDTYQGFGVGMFLKGSLGYDVGPVGASVSTGIRADPFGGISVSSGASLNVGVGKTIGNAVSLSASVGLSTNFKSVNAGANAGASVSYGSQKSSAREAEEQKRLDAGGDPNKPLKDDVGRGSFSVLDASISSSGGKYSSSVSIGGASVSNSKVGKMSTSTSGFVLPLPFLHLGYRYTRYWIDEMEQVNTNGIFYNPTSLLDLEDFDENAFDSYSLNSNYTLAKNEDPANDALGTLAAYDDYSVNAQGVAGNFKPHMLRGHMYRQNVQYYSGGSYKHRIIHLPTQKATDFPNAPINFRFVNDFSNRYQYNVHDLEFNSSNNDAVPITYEFNNAAATGDGSIDGMQNNYLIGSKHVRHFTNEQIDNDIPGFIEARASGFSRSSLFTTGAEQIGAFQIVNESGVTYHFSLPAFTRDEFQYSEKKSDIDGDTYNYSTKPTKYAYTWHLTAVTGPDYIDRGDEGFDEEDWGYWVELEYGKWSDNYTWRNPGEANQRDIDDDFVNFSDGIKEVYYLDAIRTKTHTAIFVKDIRDDAKSSLRILRNEVGTSEGTKLVVKGANKTGGFIPKEIENSNSISGFGNISKSEYTAKPVSALKLKKIVLFNNHDLAEQTVTKSTGNNFSQSMVFKNTDLLQEPDEITYVSMTQHLPDNVWDLNDIYAVENTFISNALRVVEFDSDNSTLCPETPNSYDSELLFGNGNPSTDEEDYVSTHKLALKSVKFLGKGGADLTPPVTFEYELSNPQSGSGLLSSFDLDKKRYGLANTSALNVGDIIKFTSGGKVCYATLYQANRIQIIGKNLPVTGTTISWTTTKNPPYHVDSSDEWGMFKGDYYDFNNPSIDKTRTQVSKNQVDVWSLRSITTSLGATISMEYESDMYQTAIMAKSYPLIISSMTDASTSSNPNRTSIGVNCPADMLDYFYDVNDKAEMLMIYKQEWVEVCGVPQYDSYGIFWMDGFIRQINQNTITVESNGLSDFLTQVTPVDLGVSGCVGGTRQHFKEGNLLIRNPAVDVPGGDIRTKFVTVDDSFTGVSTRTSYDYQDQTNPTRTSGVTSYSPGLINKYDPDVENLNGTTSERIARDEFKNQLYGSYSQLISRASEIPAPGVMYEYIGIHESIKNAGEADFSISPDYSVYHFSVLESSNVDHPEPTNMNSASYLDLDMGDQNGFDIDFSSSINDKKFKKVLLKDYTSRIGELKSITLYNNGKKVSETINHYLHDGLTNAQYEATLAATFNNQGRIDETFVDSRAARREDSEFALLATVTQRQRFPSIGIGQTTVNYKTGITSTSRNIAFDFYSGKVVKTLSTDGHGNSYVSEVTPAYRIYPAMGTAAVGGYNMLTQDARSTTYKVNPLNLSSKLGLVSAGVQTWSGSIPILDHSEVTGSITLSYLSQRETSGYYTARSTGLTDFLQRGEWIRFVKAGYTYDAKVESSVKNVASNRYDYKLQLITNPSEILSTGSNISAQRFSVPRKHASFSFIGDDAATLLADGLYPLTSNQLPAFTAWNKGDAVPANWQRNSELTLYDVYSHALEASDLNNQFAATKMSVDQTQIFATVANAKYKEFCYSGAEDRAFINGEAGGDVVINGTVSSIAHTGSKGISATSGNRAFTFTINGPEVRIYKISVWASKGGTTNIKCKFNGVTQTDPVLTEVGEAAGWHLFEASIAVPTSSITSLEIWCQASGSTTVFDDFRIRPFDAAMTSYVYNQWGELSHILDNNNLYTKFEYDGAGRLTATYRETLKRGDKTYGNEGVTKVSEVIYNYGKNN